MASFVPSRKIIDDILDVTGSSDTLGKREGSDERLGKRTYVTEFGLDGARRLTRESHDRADVKLNWLLSRYARHHSLEMASKGYLYHSDNDTLVNILSPYHFSIGGENVGVGTTVDGLQDAFMASATHRENILRTAFDHVAIGMARVDGHLWVTVVFYG